MNDPSTHHAGRRGRRIGLVAGLLAAGAFGGALLATALPANADPSTSSSARPDRPGDGPARGSGPARGGGGQRSDETVLTGTDADKAKSAALKALPGAAIDRVETDADGAVYEAHVTKADGTKATVKLDKDFNVTATEEGMGAHK
jgi:hypothetical protein